MLPHELSGNSNSDTLLIFLHGFPDSVRLWDNTLQGLKHQNAQFLNISYPNYHESEKRVFGQDFTIIVDRIKLTIDSIDNNRNLRKILITHDWGSIFGYMFDQKYPKYLNDMIAMDVAASFDPKGKQLLMILSYQLVFATCFLLSLIPFIGTKLGSIISIIYMRMILGFQEPNNYTAKLNYPYLYFYLNIFKSVFNKNIRFLTRYTPSVPVVFLYGQNKPFQFYGAKWQLTLSKNPDSQFIGVKSGHWIMREQPDLIIEKIIERILRGRK